MCRYRYLLSLRAGVRDAYPDIVALGGSSKRFDESCHNYLIGGLIFGLKQFGTKSSALRHGVLIGDKSVDETVMDQSNLLPCG